ncbi:MAG: carboxypeptidase regulatory-like domain-containing protein [Anaerohalosphaeraceae bacterium]
MKDACRDICELLAERLLGPLAPAQQERLERHLEGCAACRQLARQLEKHDRYLSEWSQTMRADLSDKAERAAEAFLAAGPIRQSRPLRWGWVVSAAAVVMTGAAVWLMLPSRKDIEFRHEPFKGKGIVSEPAPADRISAVPVVQNQNQLEEQTKIQLRQARYFFDTKNVPALAALYQTGAEPTRLAVLDYLAQINTPEALRVLEDLQKQSVPPPPPPAEPNQHSAIVPRAGSVPGAEKEQTEPPAAAAVAPARPVWFDPNAVDADNWRTGVLGIQVVDAVTGEPIPGAELKFDMNPKINIPKNAFTNQFGRYELNYYESKMAFLEVKIRKAPYVGAQLYWGLNSPGDTLVLPLQRRVSLRQGCSVGGRVETIDGKPVEGAAIDFSLHQTSQEEEYPLIEDAELKTDADGKWELQSFPCDLVYGTFSIAVKHPEYVPENPFSIQPLPEDLRNKTFRVLMKQGLVISGRVTDSEGRPIEGARVFAGADRFMRGVKETKTDVDGRYRLTNCTIQNLTITVTARGFAPALRELSVEENLQDVNFTLSSGYQVLVRVIDSKGYPIPSVMLRADSWGYSSLFSIGARTLPHQVQTDATGFCILEDLPPDEVKFLVQKEGYVFYQAYPITASQQNRYEIVLYPTVKLTGRVLDAQTGLPVERFQMTPGIDWNNSHQPVWQTSQRRICTNGVYEQMLYYQDVGWAVQIEAEGYWPAQSKVYINQGRDIVEDIFLAKGRGPAGTVYLPDGGPAESAEVYVVQQDRSLALENGYVRDSTRRAARTDSEGRFVLPPISGVYAVVVLHKDGLAIVSGESLEQNGSLTLQQWSRVEGRVYQNSQPVSNQTLSLYSLPVIEGLAFPFMASYDTTSDSRGTFVFSRVLPGRLRIARSQPVGVGIIRFADTIPIQVEPGQTVFIELGREGRRVTGRLRLTEDMQGRSGEHISLSIQASVPPAEPEPFPDFEMPVDYFLMTPEEQQQWIADLMKTPQMKAYYQKTDQTEEPFLIEAEVRSDGTFIADGVPPGSYILSGTVHRPGAVRDSVEWHFQSLGKIHTVFEVPPAVREGDYEKPVDIGEIAVKPFRELTVGEPLELPAMEDLQGHPIFLSDYTGRYLLMDFVMISGPFQHEKTLEELKQLYRLHQPSGRLDVLSVCLEPFAAYERRNTSVLKALRHFSEKREIPWKIGLLLSPLDLDTALYRTLFAARGSSLFLVDPQGRLAAMDISPERLEETLARYLPEVPANP